MTVHGVLHWFFRVESWLALAGGGLLLGYSGYLGVGIWRGTIQLHGGSDLPRAALTAGILGLLVLGFGYLFHRAAMALRDAEALVHPAPAFAVSVFCHIGVLAGVGAAIAL